ncbi:MAG: hypothetical protein EBX40_08425, partial [Gammaproteobacteria bacterium]|nr:hypothetical protein [Gammaproteobacteria bacterium]
HPSQTQAFQYAFAELLKRHPKDKFRAYASIPRSRVLIQTIGHCSHEEKFDEQFVLAQLYPQLEYGLEEASIDYQRLSQDCIGIAVTHRAEVEAVEAYIRHPQVALERVGIDIFSLASLLPQDRPKTVASIFQSRHSIRFSLFQESEHVFDELWEETQPISCEQGLAWLEKSWNQCLGAQASLAADCLYVMAEAALEAKIIENFSEVTSVPICAVPLDSALVFAVEAVNKTPWDYLMSYALIK